MKEAIESAKAAVVKSYEGNRPTGRKWLKAHVDSYKNKDYRIELFVLEGSPAKGFVIADYGHNCAMAFNAWGRKIRTFVPIEQQTVTNS